MSSTRTILTTAIVLTTSLVAATPIISGKIDSAMPFLTEATAWPTSSQVWWTPDASQSEWDWKTWSQSSATSTILAVSTSLAASTPSATVIQPTPSVKSESYSNPFTIYTTMTNSAGVITGMPAVVTSQPTQAPKATECSGCASVMSDQASWSSMVNSIYSTSPVAAVVSTSLASGSSHASASSTSPGFSQSTNAASRKEGFNCGAALAVFGAIACLL